MNARPVSCLLSAFLALALSLSSGLSSAFAQATSYPSTPVISDRTFIEPIKL